MIYHINNYKRVIKLKMMMKLKILNYLDNHHNHL